MGKLTAVEWFINHLIEYGFDLSLHEAEIKQAKEKEKQQIIETGNICYLNSDLIKRSVKNKKVNSVGEQYYNETFKK